MPGLNELGSGPPGNCGERKDEETVHSRFFHIVRVVTRKASVATRRYVKSQTSRNRRESKSLLNVVMVLLSAFVGSPEAAKQAPATVRRN